MSEHQHRGITEEERVRKLVEAVKGPSMEAGWQPADRLPASLRARLDAARIRANAAVQSLRRKYAAALELKDSLSNLDSYGEAVVIEKRLDQIERPETKTVFEERNFLGRSREHVRRAGQKSLFLTAKKTELENLKQARPDEYDIIAPVARSIRTVSDELARLEISFNDIGPEFDEFSKDLREDIARRRAEAEAGFAAEEAALDEYATKFKGERKALAVEMRKAMEGAK